MQVKLKAWMYHYSYACGTLIGPLIKYPYFSLKEVVKNKSSYLPKDVWEGIISSPYSQNKLEQAMATPTYDPFGTKTTYKIKLELWQNGS